MARPVTLFTGQWADLPLEELAAKCGDWGFDGLELACWGDHFEVDEALADDAYCRSKRELLERHGLDCWAIGAHLVGQAVCDPIDSRHQGVLPDDVWGDGDPEGVRQRAAEKMKDTARAAAKLGVPVVTGFTGSSIWHMLYSFPPNDWDEVAARLRGLRRALEPDHRRVRRGGREVRPRGAPHRDRLRLPDHPQGARGDRSARGLRDQLRPLALLPPVPRLGRRSSRSSPTASTTCTSRTRSRRLDGRRSILGSHIDFGEPERGWTFVSPGHGDVDFEDLFRVLNRIGYDGPLSIEWEDSGMDRDWGAPDALAFVRRTDFAPSQVAFDAAFQKEG